MTTRRESNQVFSLSAGASATETFVQQRELTRNAFAQVAGFSGTNDNEPLLPLTVKCMRSEDQHIQATDGRMMCMLAIPGKCTVTALSTPKLCRDFDVKQPVWVQLLDIARQKKAHALIDAGKQSLYNSRVLLLFRSSSTALQTESLLVPIERAQNHIMTCF